MSDVDWQARAEAAEQELRLVTAGRWTQTELDAVKWRGRERARAMGILDGAEAQLAALAPHVEALRALVQQWHAWDSICNRCFGRKALTDCEVCSTVVEQMHLAADELESRLAAWPQAPDHAE